ncbi:histidine phosphotransferase family protein [Marinovum sp. 2_MG-2023]|uniref:histidine phosphotransferase family protein n=1 Tax=Roseobacteraceae TaxID=2854170 RepID=UPI001FD0690B|nr:MULTISPECIES: histidine phosphotransferase family protein [Roseobacteraceae]MCJ7872281.1 histidine phosphotransferase family protein [Phaeobacter sp. J2-8]MDO6729449.1 histidine phosphotransferase family protein [Marinovum sp. 2_MG-2023]MDO6781315.1 histidine phosphotransferase family protein [Marinovum sp. 1_MG-2023]
MTSYTAKLASLIASRICHDLISPVGAISNGLELMTLGGISRDGPELRLVSESCDNASARIRFFRIAFGAASDNALVSRKEVAAVLQALGKAGRVVYEWVPGGDLPRREVQLALLALQCVENALPRGGVIRVEYHPGQWVITGLSERVAPDPAHWGQLEFLANSANPQAEEPVLDPNHVQFILLPILARDQGRTPEMAQGNGVITLTV